MALEINIGKVRSVKGARQVYDLETDTFDFMVPDWQLSKPLSVSLEVVNEGRYLNLTGTVKACVEGQCSRCLDKVTETVETVIRNNYYTQRMLICIIIWPLENWRNSSIYTATIYLIYRRSLEKAFWQPCQ